MRIVSPVLLLAASLLCGPLAWAAEVGDEIPTFKLEDQSGTERQLDDSIRRIYANNSRKGDGLIEEAMDKRDQQALVRQQAIVVADISEAPGFVKRIIRSGLKKRSYDTWLDKRGNTRSALPYRPDRVTVIDLAQRRIINIRHLGDAAALNAALEESTDPPAPATTPPQP